ncbi:aspartic peptidase domain-containing protein, partial [Phaeosphaeria sp. MPI-PUGE-AT-0046c]
MKLLPALIAVSFVSLNAAIQLVSRNNPRVARLDIQRHEDQDPLTHDRNQKRQKTVEQTLDNAVTFYYANVSLGTPAQNFRLSINTGASDMWVNTANSSLCSKDNQCATSGTYNANSSSTYKYVNGVFTISYADGSSASGDYATDTFRIGGQTTQNMQFGVAYRSTDAVGLLGIGYSIGEAQVFGAKLAPYPNLPQQLAKDGKINSNAYSLWMNDLAASTGSILFGGVDTAKYTGGLKSVPIIPSDGVYSAFNIALTAVGQNGTYNLMNSSNVPALLESGTSLSYLPSNITTPLYKQLGVQYDPRQMAAMVNCSLASQPGTIDFSFSGANISVPLRTLVITAGTSSGQPICVFGIAPVEGNDTVTLGDSFLRAAYVVYDLDNNQISLAQTKFNVTTERIVEIARGAGGVPTSIFQSATPTA